jgi:Ca-activated chloride channel homolog
MSFAHPERLWLLLAVPVLVLWAIRGRLRRRRSWAALAQRGRVPGVGTLRWLGTMVCLMVALAQPRWGRQGTPPPPPGHDVVLVVDVSRSMGVEDAVPYRLAVAIEAAESLVNALAEEPANRAAVVAFAGRGVLRYPLTENLGAVLDALHRLQTGGVHPGGTDLGAGLDAALEAVASQEQEHAEGRTIVVFSDGEDHADRWRSRVERLRQDAIVVHTVAIGDADQGHPVPSGGDPAPVSYHGQPVSSRRYDAALEAIAHQTGGQIIRLGLASADLGRFYQTRIQPAGRRRREASRLTDRAEQFPLVLIAALGLHLVGCWPPGRGWSWRRSWTSSWRWRRSAKILGRAALLAIAAVVAGAGQAPPPAEPQPSGSGSSTESRPLGSGGAGTSLTHGALKSERRQESVAEAVARGQAAYNAKRFDEALAAFDAAIRGAPRQAIPYYNTAAALYQLGRYGEALQRYNEARQLADPSLQTKIDYALGNTALALGDIPRAIGAYDDCLASTAPGTALEAVRRDARINRDFALQQAQQLSVPQGQGSGDSSQAQRPDQRRGPNRRDGTGEAPSSEEQSETGPEAGGSNPESDTDDPAGRRRRSTRRRRLGGAGGSRSTPPEARGDSPEDRLDEAIENIRAAQSRRIPDEPPPASANDDRKDW